MPTDLALKIQDRTAFLRNFAEPTVTFFDLPVVCLWSLLGLALSGLALVLGFGAEIVQALALAG